MQGIWGKSPGKTGFFPEEKKTTDKRMDSYSSVSQSWKPKQWPKFFELMENLTEQNYKVKVIGTTKKYQDFIVPKNLQNNPSVSFTVLSSVKELMEQIDSCTAFIGNDSGPAHYAALIGKPTTIIWGPGLFERIHARGKNVHFCIVPVNCRPCRQKGVTCQRGNNICLQNVTVEMVLEKFESSLNKHVNHSDRSSDTPL